MITTQCEHKDNIKIRHDYILYFGNEQALLLCEDCYNRILGVMFGGLVKDAIMDKIEQSTKDIVWNKV